MRGLVQAVKAYEELAIEAAHDRRPAARRCGRCWRTRWSRGWTIAEPLLDALLEANRPYLPRFFR